MGWKCSKCGQCCKEIPCVFAQVKHGMTCLAPRPCPELEQRGDGWVCLLIERDPEAAEVLLSGDCDAIAERPNKRTVNAESVVREYFPDAGDDKVGYILWNETGFPEFWRLGVDGWTPEQCLRTQLAELAGVS